MEARGLGPASLDPAQAEDDCSLVLLDYLEDTDTDMLIMRERGADLETDAERPGQRDQHQHPGGEDQQTATEARALAPRVLGGGAWS